MRTNRYTALIDSCALVGALPRNLLLSLAEAGFYRPRWSIETVDEIKRAISKIIEARGQANPDQVAADQCHRMNRAFPEAIVDGHQSIIESLSLPDPDDRHILAAAIQSGASVIVTENLQHFPAKSLANFDIAASSIDEFLADVIDLHTQGAVAAIRTMRERFKRPEITAEALITRMESSGFTEAVNLLIPEIESL